MKLRRTKNRAIFGPPCITFWSRVGVGRRNVHPMAMYSDIQRCMLRSANISGDDNYILFVGDSRVREQFYEFADNAVGVPGTYFRKHGHHVTKIKRLRLRTVRFSIIITYKK